MAFVCYSLAACQRHAPSSLAAVIGLSSNDVVSLRSLHQFGQLRYVSYVPHIPYVACVALAGNPALLGIQAIIFTGAVGLETIHQN